MIRILISACLTGERVRYDGDVIPFYSSVLRQWHKEGRLLPFCPEVAGGLPVPRPRAEIKGGDGSAVIKGDAKVTNIKGDDVTPYFLVGAKRALHLVKEHGIKLAVMKENSPSCAGSHIYDGSFSKKLKNGRGVTTALLEKNGIMVFGEGELKEAKECLENLKDC
jgi:uncharacterized protein YbbK (DUF523 family)